MRYHNSDRASSSGFDTISWRIFVRGRFAYVTAATEVGGSWNNDTPTTRSPSVCDTVVRDLAASNTSAVLRLMSKSDSQSPAAIVVPDVSSRYQQPVCPALSVASCAGPEPAVVEATLLRLHAVSEPWGGS